MTDAANTPRTALAGFARLRRLIQDELAGADDGSVFDSGAIAAYNYVLSEWPNEDEAAAPTPAYAWHANGDLCGGEDCPVLDADGDHPAPTPAEPLDVLRQELADMEAVGWPATSHEYRRGVHYAIERLAAARPEGH